MESGAKPSCRAHGLWWVKLLTGLMFVLGRVHGPCSLPAHRFHTLSHPLPHQQCPGATLTPRQAFTPPRDPPELGLLELVAARDVLVNVVQLQGARWTWGLSPEHSQRLHTEAKEELQEQASST